MAKQICIIHGGTVFESGAAFRRSLEAFMPDYDRLLYRPDWKSWLPGQLPDFDVLLPSMPNKQNANYRDWSVYFSKITPFLSPEATLIGHSLGGIFLARYFNDHPPAKRFEKLVLIAAPYDDETAEHLGDFKLTPPVRLKPAARDIYLLYSRDDPVVPVSELDKFRRDLPDARVRMFDDRQHFNAPTLPELVEIIGG